MEFGYISMAQTQLIARVKINIYKPNVYNDSVDPSWA